MAGITTNGIGSGLDINQLVGDLVKAEITPTRERLDREEAGALARISAFGLIKSAMAEFQTAVKAVASSSSFVASAVTSSDEEVLGVASSGSAARGNYSLDVQRLATAHRLVSNNGVSSENATVGTGTLTLTVGADAFDVTIDSSRNTLSGIRDAINGASGNSGVTASIIKVDDGLGGKTAKLVLSADDTGEASRIQISVDDADGNDTDGAGLSQFAGANMGDNGPLNLDALVELDGQTVTSASNVLDDTIEGLTLTLVKADPGNPVTVSASEDRTPAVEKIQTLVDGLNAVIEVLRESTRVDPNGANTGALVGDSTARFMENRLRNAFSGEVSGVNSVFGSLAAIGITTGDDGSLDLDTTKLESALTRDFDGVVGLFSSEQGVAARMTVQLDGYLRFDGVFDTRTDGLNATISRLSDRREALGAREAALESRLMAQFSAMDALVAQLQSTGDFLTQQMEAMNNARR